MIRFVAYLLLVSVATSAWSQEATPDGEGEDVLVLTDVSDSAMSALDSTLTAEAHPQDSPAERGFLIVTADGQSSLRLRGSIRLNGGYDFNGLLGKTTFSTVDIPAGANDTGETSFFMQAGQTRFGIDIVQATRAGEGFIRLELDFLGEGNTARLRHAYGHLGPLLAGQTWSTFSDVGSLPLTVDLDGPNSSVAERTIQARFTFEGSSGMQYALGIESPNVEKTEPDSLQLRPAFQSFPDVVASMRHRAEWGHLKVAGVLRSITVRNTGGELNVLAGYGALLSGSTVLPSDDGLLYQAWAGEGIAKFITAFSGRNFDVSFNPNSGKFETEFTYGGYVSYRKQWKPDLQSFVTAGTAIIDTKEFQSEDAFDNSQYVSGNVFWDPGSGARFGAEYTWGRRENRNGSDGMANRISFIVYYDF